MEIVDVHRVLLGVVAELVGGAVGDPALHAASGHPHGEGVGMVISPKGLAGNLGDRRATKLASPDDERVVEQPALLEVGQKRCGGSISSGALASMLPLDVRVRIPSSVIELHEPDALFDESSCHQTIVGEGGFSWFRAVQSKGR